jgi:hypothetical protein
MLRKSLLQKRKAWKNFLPKSADVTEKASLLSLRYWVTTMGKGSNRE